MPGIIIHTEIARRIALTMNRPDLLNERSAISLIYFHGAVAPDIGVFPGCAAFLSELSHYIKTGELAQRLHVMADSAEKQAFALGWLSHYFGDSLIHPLVNREAGRIRHPLEERSLSWEDDPVLHLQVELGLDGAMFYELGMKPFVVPDQVLDQDWCQYLAQIYSDIYGITFSVETFLNSHRRAQHFNRMLMHLGIIHAARSRGRSIGAAHWWTYLTSFLPAKGLELLLGKRSPYRKISTVYNPDTPFITAVEAGINQVVQRTIDAFSEPSTALENLNLDTGAAAIPGSYRFLDKTQAKLEQLRTGSGRFGD